MLPRFKNKEFFTYSKRTNNLYFYFFNKLIRRRLQINLSQPATALVFHLLYRKAFLLYTFLIFGLIIVKVLLFFQKIVLTDQATLLYRFSNYIITIFHTFQNKSTSSRSALLM